MTSEVLGVAWYRFRATIGSRWRGYVSIVLLVGLVGGVAMGSLAAARRTQSLFATYVASTNPSDLDVSIYAQGGGPGSGPVYSPSLTRHFSTLPFVRQARVGLVLNGLLLDRHGDIRLQTAGQAYPVASPDGLFFTQDRATVTQGRMADPTKPDEIMMAASAARLFGFHLGQVVHYGLYTNQQENSPAFGTLRVSPKIRLNAKIVGFIDLSSSVVEDDIDQVPTIVVCTPALARKLLADPTAPFSSVFTYSLQLTGGARHLVAVEREVERVIPANATFSVHAVAPIAAKADRAVKPIAIALGVFGAIALLAALLIATQAIARRLRESNEEWTVMRALGATQITTAADGLLGILGAIVLGSLLSVVVAIVLSPLSPLGPVRDVYPNRGLSVDWVVLGGGLLVLIGGLSAVAIVLAIRGAPHRMAQHPRLAAPSPSRIVEAIAGAGAPAAVVVGVRMALEPGRGRTAVPVRSALVGTALAVALVVTTLTFGSSLQTLVNHPPLYGWNWTYMLNQVGTGSAGVPPQSLTQLSHDPKVAAATGVDYNDIDIDGENIPVIFGDNQASLTPPILSGHAVQKTDEIV
ncbi:MAG TPA: hypothetical protein VNG12_01180, partial [Acidimicrobiales bacterium]|nr:hypothetical protein [Acidimicrobiales bacterium]